MITVKGVTYLAYDPSKRGITVKGRMADELLPVFDEVEEASGLA